MTQIQHVNIGPGTNPKTYRDRLRGAARKGLLAIDDDTGVLISLGHASVEASLIDKRMNSGARAVFDMQDIPAGSLRDWYTKIMFTTDGAEHSRMRRLVGKAFTPKATEGLRDLTSVLVAERLGPVRNAGSGDLMAAMSDVPMHVMCALVGISPSDIPQFIDWIDDLGPTFGFMTPEQIAAASSAIDGIIAYSLDLHDRMKTQPSNNLMSALIAAEEDGDQLNREETAAMVANLLVGGQDTTASQIGCSILTLLSHPEVMAEIRNDEHIIPSVVTETIRVEPSMPVTYRALLEQASIDGINCPAGALVICSTMTANTDPTV